MSTQAHAAGAGSYVSGDEHGVLRVAGTPISLDSVVIAFRQGESPESIRQPYPPLTLEQVYGAITYYLAKDEVEAHLRRHEERWQDGRDRSERENGPLLARLRQIKAEGQRGRDLSGDGNRA